MDSVVGIELKIFHNQSLWMAIKVSGYAGVKILTVRLGMQVARHTPHTGDYKVAYEVAKCFVWSFDFMMINCFFIDG